MQNWRIGIDVGGTNTDAVVLDGDLNLIASVKSPTTEDVTTGIYTAMKEVLQDEKVDKNRIGYAMLGTTHCTNAIVERKRLNKVVVIRIGAPATRAIKPMIDWPNELKEAMDAEYYLVQGGHEFDGREISPINEDEIRDIARKIKGNVDSIAVTAVFSPVSNVHETRVKKILEEELPSEVPISLSHEIGSVSLLERENATILNAALSSVAKTISNSFKQALEEENLNEVKIYLGQNDGTLMSLDYAIKYPILTIACGPTNSIRGASFLTNRNNAVVVDVGGTTTDVGVLVNSFPRESMVAVEIGNVRTNFRMPDLISVGLGGGTVIKEEGNRVKIGPESVGYRITEKALVFGGDTLTATDIIVAKGKANLGNKVYLRNIDENLINEAYNQMVSTFEDTIDKMKTSQNEVDVILVGGGSILVPDKIKGVSKVHRAKNYGVANAIGSAIAQVSGQIEQVFSLDNVGRDEALNMAKNMAKNEAIKAGAYEDSIKIIDVEDIPLAYLPGNATRIRVKAVGDLDI